MFLCHPVRRLLASTNQTSFLLFSVYDVFNKDLKPKKLNIDGIKSRRLRSQILNFFIFQVVEENNTSEKVVIVKEELDGFDIET